MSLRVFHVVSSFRPVLGGAERATETLTTELRRRGVDVCVLTRRYRGLASRDTVNGVPVRRMGGSSRSALGAASFGMRLIAEVAGSDRPDLIHVQNIDTPLLAGMALRRLLGVPLVVTIHGLPQIEIKRASWLGRARLKRMVREADAFVALTEGQRSALVEEGAAPGDIRLVPNGIQTARFAVSSETEREQSRRDLGLPPGARAVLYLGRLVALKQVDVLLHAWAKVQVDPRLHLLIAGDGPDRARLEAFRDALELERVHFVGAVDGTPAYYRAASVYVLPSRYEGQSVALLEAMSSGVAVVASDNAGNRTLVEDGVNGLLVPVADVEALAAAIGRLLADPATAEEFGRRGRALVERRYSLESVANAHVELYGDVLARSGRRATA